MIQVTILAFIEIFYQYHTHAKVHTQDFHGSGFMTWGHFCLPSLFNVTKAQVGYGLKYHQQTC